MASDSPFALLTRGQALVDAAGPARGGLERVRVADYVVYYFGPAEAGCVRGRRWNAGAWLHTRAPRRRRRGQASTTSGLAAWHTARQAAAATRGAPTVEVVFVPADGSADALAAALRGSPFMALPPADAATRRVRGAAAARS